ncbi:hypothetical protein HS7_20550 [Sulfolobales archaeon HS-7]|nr:hypothetical protein HS7_20550 [Sulfolobales archaeon HS-7]
MMETILVVITYTGAFLFLMLQSEIRAYRDAKQSICVKRSLFNIEFYECPARGYFSYKMLNGKKILYRGIEEDKAAYYHELGHLIHDNFLLDPLLTSVVIFPLFLLSLPWNWLTAFVMFIIVKWRKKNEERRADIFAYEITGRKYTPIKLEKNKLGLLLHWIFWSHPPEKVRINEEYYKKGVSLFRLFLKSLFSN